MKCPVEITSAHLVYDRSRTTTDWDCPRKRYWQYEHEGTGITPEVDAVELFTGSVIHDAMSAIAQAQLNLVAMPSGEVDIDGIALAAANKMMAYHCPEDLQNVDSVVVYAKEQAALIYGMLKGFYQQQWPKLMEKYDIVCVEEEMFYIHDQYGKGDLKAHFVMMVKPDLVLRDKTSGELVYLEYKSTSSKKEGWMAQWEDAVQVHSTLNAIEQTFGERPVYVIVQGLYKGYESYGKQSSPFCYAYGKQGQPPFSKTEYSYEYKYGLRRIPTWELDGGTKAWVEGMPEAILADQFPQTPPIFCNDDLIENYFMQRAMRELEIKMAKQIIATADELGTKVVLNGAFPQRFDRCKIPTTPPRLCPMRLLCHGNCKDPLKAGFTKREPHHELEITQQQAARTENLVQEGLESETNSNPKLSDTPEPIL